MGGQKPKRVSTRSGAKQKPLPVEVASVPQSRSDTGESVPRTPIDPKLNAAQGRRTSLPGPVPKTPMNPKLNGCVEVVSSEQSTTVSNKMSPTLEGSSGGTTTSAAPAISLDAIKALLDMNRDQITQNMNERMAKSEQAMTKKIDDMDKKFENDMASLREECSAQIATQVREAEERIRTQLVGANQQTPIPVEAAAVKPVTVDTISANVTREMTERKKRERNLVAHGIGEAGTDVKGLDREDFDVDMVKGLLEAMDTGIQVTELKKVRRIGKYLPDRTTPRPMLIEFESKEQRDKVQTKARTLSRRVDDFKDYRLVPDLTDQQRRDDKDVKDHCDKANLERSQAEKNAFEWKPVGPKGSKRAEKVPIRLDSDGAGSREQGESQRVDWRERARKRYGDKD